MRTGNEIASDSDQNFDMLFGKVARMGNHYYTFEHEQNLLRNGKPQVGVHFEKYYCIALHMYTYTYVKNFKSDQTKLPQTISEIPGKICLDKVCSAQTRSDLIMETRL